MLERIFPGPSVQAMISSLRMTAGFAFSEYSDLSIDGTVTVIQSIVGNVPEGKKGQRLDTQDRRCLTVKGRTGCVINVALAVSEKFDCLLAALVEAVPPPFRPRVQAICCDHVPNLLCDQARLRESFPSLRCISEDPHSRQDPFGEMLWREEQSGVLHSARHPDGPF